VLIKSGWTNNVECCLHCQQAFTGRCPLDIQTPPAFGWDARVRLIFWFELETG
jgi:hypothetical protein